MSLCLPLGVVWRVWTGVAGVYKNVSPIMIGVNTNALGLMFISYCLI